MKTKTPPPAFQIQLKGGKTLDFRPFKIKDKNFRKVNLNRGGSDNEGIWACFSDADVKKYDNDKLRSAEYETVVILVNSSLHFFPHNSWGLYIPIKFRGTERPTCDLNDMDGQMTFCKERTDAEKAEKAKENEKARK